MGITWGKFHNDFLRWILANQLEWLLPFFNSFPRSLIRTNDRVDYQPLFQGMSLRSPSRKDSSRGGTQDLRERQKSSLGREAVCRKWNGEFWSEYFNRNKRTTSRGNPEHCGQKKPKGAFPFEFRPKFRFLWHNGNHPYCTFTYSRSSQVCPQIVFIHLCVRLICFESRVVSWRTSRDFTLLNIFDCTDSMNFNYFL